MVGEAGSFAAMMKGMNTEPCSFSSMYTVRKLIIKIYDIFFLAEMTVIIIAEFTRGRINYHMNISFFFFLRHTNNNLFYSSKNNQSQSVITSPYLSHSHPNPCTLQHTQTLPSTTTHSNTKTVSFCQCQRAVLRLTHNNPSPILITVPLSLHPDLPRL